MHWKGAGWLWLISFHRLNISLHSRETEEFKRTFTRLTEILSDLEATTILQLFSVDLDLSVL
jgi:molybdenum cofactor biosynthesis enzyme MoaA